MWGEMTEAEILSRVMEVVRRKLPKDFQGKVFLFGSRAAGTAGERSDFDIGIDAGKRLPAGTISWIEEELDLLPDLRKVEVVDFSDVTDDFRRVAMGKTKELL